MIKNPKRQFVHPILLWNILLLSSYIIYIYTHIHKCFLSSSIFNLQSLSIFNLPNPHQPLTPYPLLPPHLPPPYPPLPKAQPPSHLIPSHPSLSLSALPLPLPFSLPLPLPLPLQIFKLQTFKLQTSISTSKLTSISTTITT